jgi:hypothetical protein
MTRCKECLYYKICKSYADDVLGSNRNDDELFCDCSDFKNKADFQEVKHGKWGMGLDEAGYEYGTCSVCGYTDYHTFPRGDYPFYCSRCGAKMDGDGE